MCSEDEGWDFSGMCEALSGGVYDVWFCFGVGQGDGEKTKDRPLRSEIMIISQCRKHANKERENINGGE
jgi:hypothetical protein